MSDACPAVHPQRGLPCVRTGNHRRHAAETKRESPTYHATDVWPWANTEWDGTGSRDQPARW